MTETEKARIWEMVRKRMAERKAAHEEEMRQLRVHKLVAWIKRK